MKSKRTDETSTGLKAAVDRLNRKLENPDRTPPRGSKDGLAAAVDRLNKRLANAGPIMRFGNAR